MVLERKRGKYRRDFPTSKFGSVNFLAHAVVLEMHGPGPEMTTHVTRPAELEGDCTCGGYIVKSGIRTLRYRLDTEELPYDVVRP